MLGTPFWSTKQTCRISAYAQEAHYEITVITEESPFQKSCRCLHQDSQRPATRWRGFRSLKPTMIYSRRSSLSRRFPAEQGPLQASSSRWSQVLAQSPTWKSCHQFHPGSTWLLEIGTSWHILEGTSPYGRQLFPKYCLIGKQSLPTTIWKCRSELYMWFFFTERKAQEKFLTIKCSLGYGFWTEGCNFSAARFFLLKEKHKASESRIEDCVPLSLCFYHAQLASSRSTFQEKQHQGYRRRSCPSICELGNIPDQDSPAKMVMI